MRSSYCAPSVVAVVYFDVDRPQVFDEVHQGQEPRVEVLEGHGAGDVRHPLDVLRLQRTAPGFLILPIPLRGLADTLVRRATVEGLRGRLRT